MLTLIALLGLACRFATGGMTLVYIPPHTRLLLITDPDARDVINFRLKIAG
jgi:hypothetical protein